MRQFKKTRNYWVIKSIKDNEVITEMFSRKLLAQLGVPFTQPTARYSDDTTYIEYVSSYANPSKLWVKTSGKTAYLSQAKI